MRTFANAPRTLDLDLLLYGDAVIETEHLTVPHPRLHERAFVLVPLAEIAAGVVVPGWEQQCPICSICIDDRSGVRRFAPPLLRT